MASLSISSLSIEDAFEDAQENIFEQSTVAIQTEENETFSPTLASTPNRPEMDQG